jgi:tRNA-2-methylthio-N6-dimethylallyladenosine synthase
MVNAGHGRKDAASDRLSGRAADNRLVHVNPAGGNYAPGDLLTATVTHAAPHHLVADSAVELVWRRPAPPVTCGTTPASTAIPVNLGMPTVPQPTSAL